MSDSRQQASTRCAGVLMHLTSLPGGHGIGDLGAGATRFIDWLNAAGMKAWQVLPLTPVGSGNSPYSSTSAFAGNPLLIDLDGLVGDGLLTAAEIEASAEFSGQEQVDFEAVRAFKEPLLARAAHRLARGHNSELMDARRHFEKQTPWLADAALFQSIRTAQNYRPWWEWPKQLRDRDPDALEVVRDELRDGLSSYVSVQFFFDRQWKALSRRCRDAEITLIGDLPIYVDLDSADVWAHRELFRLDDDLRPLEVAGVPPDAFSETGQLWGNPVFDWDQMAADGYQWWKRRLGRALEQTPRVRVDHFRGFASYWAVPAGASDATGGRWAEGPGMALFEAFSEEFGDPLPIIAEDLGMVDAPVRALLAATGLPGMRVLQFGFDGKSDNPHLPAYHPKKSVAYTGTHDNDTTLGWWLRGSKAVQSNVRSVLGTQDKDIVWALIEAAYGSAADTAIIPMQDVLGLGSEARMNTPAQPAGNWVWRLDAEQLSKESAQRLHKLSLRHGRLRD